MAQLSEEVQPAPRILPLCNHKSIADGTDDVSGKGRSNDRSAHIRTECIAGGMSIGQLPQLLIEYLL